MKKYLMLGGTLSGKHLNIPEGNTFRNVIRQAQPPDIPPIEEVYHKHQFSGTEIYLHCSIKPEHIVKLLKLSHGQEAT